jgi:hypothetical protein
MAGKMGSDVMKICGELSEALARDCAGLQASQVVPPGMKP